MPWLLLAAGVAAAWYFFSESGGNSSAKQIPADQKAGLDVCLASVPDPQMREKIRAIVLAAYAGTGNPDTIEAAAKDAQAQGWLSAAACLRGAAADLRKQQQKQ